MAFQWLVFSLSARVARREDGKVLMLSWPLLRTAGRAERRCLVAFFKCFVALPAAVVALPAAVFALPASVVALPASVIALPAAVIALPAAPFILPAAARRFANVKMGNTAFGFRRKM